jgi:hypothetical protein
MRIAHLPFYVVPSAAARALLGRELPAVAVLALQAILRNHRGIEVAHQQIRFRKHHLAFSSRIGRHGDLIVDLDIGDPQLGGRVILEGDLQRAERRAREEARPGRERDGHRYR